MDEIRNKSNINMVTCCKCDSILLHRMTEETKKCYSCNQHINLNDCEDYFYEGMPNLSILGQNTTKYKSFGQL
jgi:hypothetical protein